MAETCFRIMHANFIDSEILANSSASSEDPDFPIENAFDQNRRSKVYRSAGFFKVDSTNKVILFTEGGVDKTATIIESEYTSIAAMSAAVASAMNAAAPSTLSTYTVLNDSTTFFKFKITSDGSGGLFTIKWDDGSTTSEDLLGFDASLGEDTGSLNYTADFVRINTEEEILFDMGISSNPKMFVIIGKRNESIKLDPSGVIKLQANETNNFTSPSFSKTLTYDDEAIIETSDNGIGDQNYRFWRIVFEMKDFGQGFIEVGAFFLGDFFNPVRGRVQFPLSSSMLDRSSTVFSEGGQSFTDERQVSQEYSFRWLGLQKADIDVIENDIWEVFKTAKPFFVSMDDNAVFSTSRNRRVVFVKFGNKPKWDLGTPDNFTVQMNIREEL